MASRGKKKQTEAQDMKNTQINRQTDGISGTTGAGGVNGKSRTDRKIKILKTVLAAAAGCAALYIAAGLAYAAVVCLSAGSSPSAGHGGFLLSAGNIRGTGLTVYDSDENIYKTVYAGGETEVSYEKIPQEFVELLPAGFGYGNVLKAYFTGNLKSSAAGMLAWEAEKNGIENMPAGRMAQSRQAAQLAKNYSEQQLYEMLWNGLYFGNGVYGIANAAKAYESCLLENLDENQVADLVNIAKSILKENKYPDEDDVDTQTAYCAGDAFCDGLIKQLTADLKKKGKAADEAAQMLYFGGMRAYATVDSDLSQTVALKYEDRFNFTTLQSGGFIQSAMAITDYNGAVRAVAGGTARNLLYNRALSVKRQIGSTIKPFSVYAPAVEAGKIHFSSLIPDEPIAINKDGQIVLWPDNYDGVEGGMVTVTQALQVSKNTAAVQVCRAMGEQTVYEFLRDKLLFTNLNGEEDNNLSALALGYLSDGITLDKLSSCYTMFGNGGTYEQPYLYEKLCSAEGEMIVKSTHKGVKAVSTQTADIMNHLLINNVTQPQALAKEAAIDGIEVAGKTGTVGADGEVKCQYFVGMTPEYIGAVWIGFDEEEERLNLKNYLHVTQIWKNIFQDISCEKTAFDRDSTVENRMYCEKSGNLASPSCENVQEGWYSVDNLPGICTECGQ
ncbi:MAG: penicillin-binding transpeptidase domain-containing protein [Lachnospira sp.]